MKYIYIPKKKSKSGFNHNFISVTYICFSFIYRCIHIHDVNHTQKKFYSINPFNPIHHMHTYRSNIVVPYYNGIILVSNFCMFIGF